MRVYIMLLAFIKFGFAVFLLLRPVDATVTAYSCDPPAPMYPCNVTRWGSDPRTTGAACPESWRGYRVKVHGTWYTCDDTPRHDYLFGKPHIDLRLPDHQAAVEHGIQEIEIYVEKTR